MSIQNIETFVYTVGVPADMSPNEIGIADARSNLTELVAHVRLLNRIKYLTNRSRRVAAIVPVEVAEWVERNADTVMAMIREGRDPSG